MIEQRTDMSTTPKKSFSFGRSWRTIHLLHSFDVLDEFHSLLHAAASQSEQNLRDQYEGLSPDSFENDEQMEAYRSYLEDDFYQLGEAKKLGHALAISGLYRQVETHIKRVLGSTFPDIGPKKISKILLGVPQSEIDGSKLLGFAAVDELRMLNNLIKHAGSKADADLAKKYAGWVENAELNDLDKAYERLKPLVKQYMRAFVNDAYDRSTAFEAAPAKTATGSPSSS
ncbi:hypothetical protein AO254_18335 [Pseudomonas syringae]|nr:hypothetical protein AO254_18335 [Pseudomonas syringae]